MYISYIDNYIIMLLLLFQRDLEQYYWESAYGRFPCQGPGARVILLNPCVREGRYP